MRVDFMALRSRAISHEIARVAREEDVGLILVGAVPHIGALAGRQQVFSETIENLLRRAHCRVIVTSFPPGTASVAEETPEEPRIRPGPVPGLVAAQSGPGPNDGVGTRCLSVLREASRDGRRRRWGQTPSRRGRAATYTARASRAGRAQRWARPHRCKPAADGGRARAEVARRSQPSSTRT